MAKFVSKLSYVFSLLSFRKFYFLQKISNNLLIGDFVFSLQKLSSEEVFFSHLFVEIFPSGNFIFISLNKSRCVPVHEVSGHGQRDEQKTNVC